MSEKGWKNSKCSCVGRVHDYTYNLKKTVARGNVCMFLNESSWTKIYNSFIFRGKCGYRIKIKIWFKGTINVISSNPPLVELPARFTTCLYDQVYIKYPFLFLKTNFFSVEIFRKKYLLANFPEETTGGNYQKNWNDDIFYINDQIKF